MKFVITGRPATKKNSSRVVRRGKFTRVLPSEAFMKYEREAVKQIKALHLPTITGPVQVEFLYWLTDRRWWPDLVGLLQATSDILQTAGIIEDDKWILCYNLSRICGLDKENPRAIIKIWPAFEDEGE